MNTIEREPRNQKEIISVYSRSFAVNKGDE